MASTFKTVAVMCFSSGNGGMERSAVRLADFLSTMATVVLVCKKDSFVENLYHEQERAYECESIAFTSRKFSLSMLSGARAVVQKHGIGNVIFFGASELKTLHFSFRPFDLNLIVWHGTTKSHAKRDFLHRLVYSRVNYHVALSQHLIRNVQTIVPQTEGVQYKVIRPSFDFQVNESKEKGQTKKLSVVHVGRVAYGKGQLDAVLACESLYKAGMDFHLTLVGSADGSGYIEEVKQAVNESSIKHSVTVTGYVDSVNRYLEQADILLFPSSGEGMPNAFIEALHYNIVCIAYDNTVFPEFLEMGFYVKLVKDADIHALSEELLTVSSGIENEKIKAKNNMVLAKACFSVERELAEWRQVLV